MRANSLLFHQNECVRLGEVFYKRRCHFYSRGR